MEQKNQFRTAGFGGFHRQDVLDYIERTAKEQAEQQAELNRSLQAAQDSIHQQQATIASLQHQLECADKETQEAKTAREAAEAERDALSQQLSQVLEEGQSVEQLKQQLADARRQAEGYLRLKSDYAEIELDARQRASSQLSQARSQAEELTAQAQAQRETLLAQAKDQAEALLETAQNQAAELLAQAQDEVCQLQAQRRQLLIRTRRDFDTSSADLNVSITSALREVETLRQSLLDLNTTFEENAHAVDELCGEEA